MTIKLRNIATKNTCLVLENLSYADLFQHMIENGKDSHQIKTEHGSCRVKYNPDNDWIEWTLK